MGVRAGLAVRGIFASLVTILEFLSLVRGADSPLLFANGLLLLMVTFVPFPAPFFRGTFFAREHRVPVLLVCGRLAAPADS